MKFYVGDSGVLEDVPYDKRGLALVERGPNAPKLRKKKAKAKTPTPKFKVGDKVIGNNAKRYNITNLGWIGTVVRADENSIDAEGPDTDGVSIVTFHDLEPVCFDLYTGGPEKTEGTTEKPSDSMRDYPPYLDYPKPRRKQTNGDKIREMTDGELAHFLEARPDAYPPIGTLCSGKNCYDCWCCWLKQEVSE